jgi:hypothetical protein
MSETLKKYENFETFLGEQSEEVRALYETHLSGMLNTIKATRQERDNFSHELKELSKRAVKGSETDIVISDLTEKLAKSERKSTFLTKASEAGCLRPSAAYALASSENLFTEEGEPDWKKIKENVPELFKITNTNTNAGSGTSTAARVVDPNAIIREAAHK